MATATTRHRLAWGQCSVAKMDRIYIVREVFSTASCIFFTARFSMCMHLDVIPVALMSSLAEITFSIDTLLAPGLFAGLRKQTTADTSATIPTLLLMPISYIDTVFLHQRGAPSTQVEIPLRVSQKELQLSRCRAMTAILLSSTLAGTSIPTQQKDGQIRLTESILAL